MMKIFKTKCYNETEPYNNTVYFIPSTIDVCCNNVKVATNIDIYVRTNGGERFTTHNVGVATLNVPFGITSKEKISNAILELEEFIQTAYMRMLPKSAYDPCWFANVMTKVGKCMFPTIHHKIALRALLNTSEFVDTYYTNYGEYRYRMITDINKAYTKEEIRKAKKEVKNNSSIRLNLSTEDESDNYYYYK